jgi:hypothetical protein
MTRRPEAEGRTDRDGDVHVIAPDAYHDDSVHCLCEPDLVRVDDETGRRVWLHREMQ